MGVAEELGRAVSGGCVASVAVRAAVHDPVLCKLLAHAQSAGYAAVLQRRELIDALMEHRRPFVLLGRGDGQRALAGLVERGCAADVARAANGDVGIASDHDGGLLRSHVEGDGLVLRRVDEPLAVALAGEGVAVDDIHLLRPGLDGDGFCVVALEVALIGADAHHVGLAGLED